MKSSKRLGARYKIEEILKKYFANPDDFKNGYDVEKYNLSKELIVWYIQFLREKRESDKKISLKVNKLFQNIFNKSKLDFFDYWKKFKDISQRYSLKDFFRAVYLSLYEEAISNLKNDSSYPWLKHFIFSSLDNYQVVKNLISDSENFFVNKNNENIIKDKIDIHISLDKQNYFGYFQNYSSFLKFASLVEEILDKAMKNFLPIIVETIICARPRISADDFINQRVVERYKKDYSFLSSMNEMGSAKWEIVTDVAEWKPWKLNGVNLSNNKFPARKEDIILFMNPEDFNDLSKGVIDSQGRICNLNRLKKQAGFIYPLLGIEQLCSRIMDRNALKIFPNCRAINLDDIHNHKISLEFDVKMSLNFHCYSFSPRPHYHSSEKN